MTPRPPGRQGVRGVGTPWGMLGSVAGRHGVPQEERLGHRTSAKTARRRRRERLEATEGWPRWLALRVPLVLVQLVVLGLGQRLLARDHLGLALLAILAAVAGLAVIAVDLRRRLRLRRRLVG